MFKGLAIAALLTLSCVHGTLSAQQSAPRPFKALCVSEKETGFNWVSGDWVQTNFKAGEKLLIQKIAPKEPWCKADTKNGMFGTSGCYQIKALGSAPSISDIPEMCDEISEKNTLKVVHCRKISFHPDGRFIRLPEHSDISDNPKNGVKDSLALSVGKCSRIVE
jgi:hypothetical protein